MDMRFWLVLEASMHFDQGFMSLDQEMRQMEVFAKVHAGRGT